MTWLADHWLDLFGWAGSALLIVSLLQARVLRFRVLNLVAGLMLVAFNALIGVWPMVAMNLATSTINVYFITRLLRDPGAVLQVPHVHRGVRVVDQALVRRAHADGRHVHVWTVDEPDEMEHLIDLGVDGLITDRTDVLKDVLLARGLWEGTT